MLRATDENGNVLPEFEKVLDIDIKAAAEAALGKELTQNLLSVVFDYDGNLWFATVSYTHLVVFCKSEYPLHPLKPCKNSAETVHLLWDK